MFKNWILLLFMGLFSLPQIQAQDTSFDDLENMLDDTEEAKPMPVTATFKSTRIINSHSNETVKGGALDFLVTHRFGDIIDDDGPLNLFGIDNAADILIGLEYGITDDLTIGIGRAKAAGLADKLYYTSLKYRVLKQTTDNSMPLALTLYGNTAISGAKKVDDPTAVRSFPNWHNRFSFIMQAIIARKFNKYFSLQLTASYLHRNFVPFADENHNFGLGLATRVKLSNRIAILLEASTLFSKYRYNQDYRNENNVDFSYFLPLGVGIEFETGGHVFQVNFTNNQGIVPNDYLAYATSNWLDGEFRLGFTISRVFQLKK